MKITLSFDALSPEEISAARRVLNSLDPHGAAREVPRGEVPFGAPPRPTTTASDAGETNVPPPPPDGDLHVPVTTDQAPPPPDDAAVPPPPPNDEAPPPPPPDSDSSTAPAPKPPEGGAVELDALGHPWDARFHVLRKKTGERPKLKDGSWRRRKGVKKEDVIAALGEPPGAPGGPDAEPPPPPPPPPPAPAVLTTETAPPPPDGAVPVPSAAANGGVPAATWDMVVAAFSERASKYTQAQLQGALLAQNIDPVTLFETPVNHGPAIQVLKNSCPL